MGGNGSRGRLKERDSNDLYLTIYSHQNFVLHFQNSEELDFGLVGVLEGLWRVGLGLGLHLVLLDLDGLDDLLRVFADPLHHDDAYGNEE